MQELPPPARNNALALEAEGNSLLDLEVLEGTINHITFRNEENLYTVARLLPNDSKTPVTCVGRFISVHPGESFRLRGEWTTHPQYGRQFRVEAAEPLMPATVDGIKNYLASGLIKGVGPSTAEKLVDKFGLTTLDVISVTPERLQEVEGIGPVKAKAIQEGLSLQEDIQNIMVFLQGHGISPAYAHRIYRHYRQDTIAVLQENPYRLADDVTGIGFRIADGIAQNLGITAEAPERIRAGIKYTLEQSLGEGHVCLPKDTLQKEAEKILDVSSPLIVQGLETLLKEGTVQEEIIDEREVIYLPMLKAMEEAVAERLVSWNVQQGQQDFLKQDLIFLLEEAEKRIGIQLAPNQRQAVLSACQESLLIITGGPGTGKTTIVKVILEMYATWRWKTLLASPTGRAAKRLAESTGRPAQTIHRLLEFGYEPDAGLQFRKNAENPLKADVVIIDEVSMVDMRLFYHLLMAIDAGTRLILVGDADQLPPVGPGQPLSDMIEAGEVPLARLTEVFRQAQTSLIVTNAHRINRGDFPYLNQPDKDFFLIEQKDSENTPALIVKLAQERLPAHYGFDPLEDIQVLSPIRRTRVGTAILNEHLQAALNPPKAGKTQKEFGSSIFRVGDKVMQTENDYDKKVFNGDMGRIVSIDTEEHSLIMELNDVDETRYISYERSDWDQLELSYAISVHKSQGSEYPVVIMPLVWTLPSLMNRNLLYTAITRAKQLVVLVGEKRALAVYIRQERGRERFTGLIQRLKVFTG